MNRKSVKRFLPTLIFLSSFLFCCVVLGTSTNGSPKLQNSEYHVGVVLLYQNDAFEVATPNKIDYDERNYVLIHGARSRIVSEKTLELARAIRKQDPDGNILAVDWAYFAGFNEEKIEDIIEEQAQEFIAETLATLFVEVITDKDMSDSYEKAVQDNISTLAARILVNVLPVEQTTYIPLVADRAASLLFDKKRTKWEFTTNGKKATFVSLGLDPQNTHIVGHSYGAHVAGMICKYCKKENGVLVDRLTALEPSPHSIHISEENKDGKGWNANVARYVDVYKTSLFFSSDRLYGDVNLEARMSNHPLNQIDLDSDDELEDAIPTLLLGFKTELTLHSSVIDVFITLIKEEDSLTTEYEPQEGWIVEEY